MQPIAPLLLLTVYYECLCPDSRSFITDQLHPVMEKLSNYLKIDLIPYGKASTAVAPDGKYTFKCQHGGTECLGNKVHACSILRAKDDLTRVRLATCMISNNYLPDKIGQECCERFNINWEEVKTCAHGDQGSILLNNFGQLTHSLSPPIGFIPTITINKDQGNQVKILKNLLKVVCEHMDKLHVKPIECKDQF
ncbi:GILT-like protein 1 [Rhodnius prolixus]